MKCPFCKVDTDSAAELTRHVERAHRAPTCPRHGQHEGDPVAPGVACNGKSAACPQQPRPED